MKELEKVVAEAADLLASAGLTTLTVEGQYSAEFGWYYSAYAFNRETKSVTLVSMHCDNVARTPEELQSALHVALVEYMVGDFATITRL